MLPETHELSFTFLDVGGADAIWIWYLGNDALWHNILVDGGYGRSYRHGFKPIIQQISKGEAIDLWTVSHIDRDHIGTVLGYVQDESINNKQGLVKEFWFNYSPLTVSETSDKIGVSQGIKFRDYLQGQGYTATEGVTTQQQQTDLYGLKISILSPSPAKAQLAAELWKDEEYETRAGRSADQADHGKKVEELLTDTHSEDEDPWNGSSIAYMVEFKSIRALLLADSHPSVVCSSLKRLGYSAACPVKVDFMQLSHHGSKGNTSDELLSLVSTANYVVTGNGVNNRHPDKQTLVRILTREGRPAGRVTFIFPSDTTELRDLFAVDEDPFNRYDFTCSFSVEGKKMQVLEYLALTEINYEQEHRPAGDYQDKM